MFAAAVVVIAIFLASTPPIAGQYAVAFPLCAAGADDAGVAHSSVFGILNLAWGLGFLVGPAAGAAIAEASSDRVTYAILRRAHRWRSPATCVRWHSLAKSANVLG